MSVSIAGWSQEKRKCDSDGKNVASMASRGESPEDRSLQPASDFGFPLFDSAMDPNGFSLSI